MTRFLQPLSTEQVRAFVALARCKTIRAAAYELCLSEEGARSRILALEERLGIILYDKHRGRRGEVVLTNAGHAFLNKAIPFVEEARVLSEPPGLATWQHGGIKIAVNPYLVINLLAVLVNDFQALYPGIPIHLSTRVEHEVIDALRSDASLVLGMCAPGEIPADLACRPWFSVGWRFVTSPTHWSVGKSSLTLEQLASEPLIIFEPGCAARQNLLHAFYQHGLTPRIVAEAASTQVVLRMVEAGLGTALLPLPPAGSLTRGMSLSETRVSDHIRPVEFSILTKLRTALSADAQTFLDYVIERGPRSVLENVPTSPDERSATGLTTRHAAKFPGRDDGHRIRERAAG